MEHLLGILTTEQPNPNTADIDRLDSASIMTLINDEDRLIAELIRPLVPQIAAAADAVVEAFRSGGRLLYVGAGTSGRIGILDASECPPTFGTPSEQVQGLIAGGFRAIKDPVEGAEDREELGAADIDGLDVDERDVVLGIAASGRTPYVLGAMKKAILRGAVTFGLCNNADTPMANLGVPVIEAVMGPEVVMGSTRMKAGTSQKLILNMLTTTAMIRSGKVYRNLMVDLNPSNEKLVFRAKRIIKLATGADDRTVEAVFSESGNQVKTAIVMIEAGIGANEARARLAASDGFVHEAIRR
ncbi:N-acetylmuramic acid 6-phosphate etherase [Saccharibacillus endophyticus]|uniref:N-acetylmuramic acid 6-phosphate etherase n=1 Tax=Saccharibacillus endophyticus TaxID=2060666 RepID=A0ABQ2A0L2_9BACL|nr:N-acetylmuramic acid 6-phosphate etherase [Saccharibacillus endophyticus]GGH82204.1 N-acetylmuramic acid 6-phosphate etherase [Saccharibacillus endophyticus]